MSATTLNEYWLISAPGDKTCQQTWDVLNNVTSKQNNLSLNYKFHIPDLKVGTLDVLVGLSDDLAKLDSFTEGVTRKIASYFADVLEDQKDKLAENLHANGQEIASYVTKFQWDMAKYPIKQPLRNLTEIISKQVSQIETDLKNKSAAYNNLKSTLQSMERKQVGSLLTRNVSDLVKKRRFRPQLGVFDDYFSGSAPGSSEGLVLEVRKVDGHGRAAVVEEDIRGQRTCASHRHSLPQGRRRVQASFQRTQVLRERLRLQRGQHTTGERAAHQIKSGQKEAIRSVGALAQGQL